MMSSKTAVHRAEELMSKAGRFLESGEPQRAVEHATVGAGYAQLALALRAERPKRGTATPPSAAREGDAA